MRVESTYYAFDDTEFYTEEECLNYEKMIRTKLDAIVFFDSNRKRMDSENPYEIATDAIYAYIVRKEDADDLIEWLANTSGYTIDGMEGISNGDIFKYDSDDDEWHNMKRTIADLTVELEEIEKVVKPNV